MVEGTRTSFRCSSHISNTVNKEKRDIPRVNEIQNLWMFVNSAVIHDDYRVRCGIGIHVIQEASNKRIKTLCTKGAFNDITMDNSIVKRNCRQNRESKIKSAIDVYYRTSDIPTSTHNKGFPLSFGSTNRPRTTSVRNSAIDRWLVYKNKLLRIVYANPRNVVETLFCRTFGCNTSELGDNRV